MQTFSKWKVSKRRSPASFQQLMYIIIHTKKETKKTSTFSPEKSKAHQKMLIEIDEFCYGIMVESLVQKTNNAELVFIVENEI